MEGTSNSRHNTFCCRRSTFDIYKIILKLVISAETPKSFNKSGTIEGHNLGKVIVKVWAQNITYVIYGWAIIPHREISVSTVGCAI